MPAHSLVEALVVRARAGDQNAWDELVKRYSPMVWSICRGYLASRQDIDDAAQRVWMLAVEHLSRLRKADRFGSWLATTTKHECFRTLRARREHLNVELPPDITMYPDDKSLSIDQALEAAERDAALRAAFARLSPACQRIISLLIQDVPYTEISARLGIPIGSIGPTRARCLAKLRGDPELAALMDAGTPAPGGDRRG
ncbi:sigma-70 family RNA polymerase sigma factor [Acrocarpospora sp. B8E8]|uniref:RNA polymerase sigma factor n=1 Tax=Acrocarpospora sp. B8E8 TaxID=3153572 RepID=UPI00325DD74A